MGSYYIVGDGKDIRIPTVAMVIAERNMIGDFVGAWAKLVERLALADRELIELPTKQYKLSEAHVAQHATYRGKIHGRAALIP